MTTKSVKNSILTIRNRLDKIHQQNIKYLIELEKKKNAEKKQKIIGLDDDGDINAPKNKLLIGKQKKLKSQQEKIYIHLPDDTDDQNDITEYNTLIILKTFLNNLNIIRIVLK